MLTILTAALLLAGIALVYRWGEPRTAGQRCGALLVRASTEEDGSVTQLPRRWCIAAGTAAPASDERSAPQGAGSRASARRVGDGAHEGGVQRLGAAGADRP